ncbi:Uncharacterised protein [Mycobacteroides abscessus subsp. abscessus]|nr:Uncharacterised protein [Mycobacteroides abscessus subsp. abscessus]
MFGVGQRHGVGGTAVAERAEGVVLVAEDRDHPIPDPDDVTACARVARDAGADHHVTVAGIVHELGREDRDGIPITNGENRCQAFARMPTGTNPAPPQLAADEQPDGAQWECQGQVTACDLEPRQQRHDRDHAERPEGRGDHAAILLDATAEDRRGAGVMQGQDTQPQAGQHQRVPGVEHGGRRAVTRSAESDPLREQHREDDGHGVGDQHATRVMRLPDRA